jgi:hypothetical protein
MRNTGGGRPLNSVVRRLTNVDASIMVQEGQRYRVKRDYIHANHSFRSGEEVVFKTSAYSAKEGVTRYWFQSLASNDINVWHAFDGDAAAEDFNATFELIGAA